MSTSGDLAFLFSRDLTRLGKQIEAFPNDETLWQTLPGVLNPAGIDLSPAAAAQLGLPAYKNEWVTVTFLWEPKS